MLGLTKKDTPCPGAKEKPQQEGMRGEITFRKKAHTHQRCSEGSNKACAHQDPETPTEAKLELCSSVSCRGTGQKWPAAKAEALGSNRPRYGISLLGGGNPTIEPPERTQDWGNGLLEGTNKTLCAPGPRTKEQWPNERLAQTCP